MPKVLRKIIIGVNIFSLCYVTLEIKSTLNFLTGKKNLFLLRSYLIVDLVLSTTKQNHQQAEGTVYALSLKRRLKKRTKFTRSKRDHSQVIFHSVQRTLTFFLRQFSFDLTRYLHRTFIRCHFC